LQSKEKAVEFTALDATELAQAIRRRQCSAVEAVRAAIGQIERLNRLVNAVEWPQNSRYVASRKKTAANLGCW
jgi:Asp-tRNA(Asn)/Glu-tRNA(Gln) amidotransferase A subunit family amidase